MRYHILEASNITGYQAYTNMPGIFFLIIILISIDISISLMI